MLLIVNCKAIYGTEIPMMSGSLKRMGHEIVVFGGPDDRARGEILRAERAMRVERSEVSESDTVEGRRWAMVDVMESYEHGLQEALVISDEPRDRAAAESLNLPTISPFDFGFEYLGEEPE